MKIIKSNLNLVPYSKKQLQLSTWWHENSPHVDKDIIIVDGAVRSGKTIIGSISFILWSMFNFNNKTFGIAGKSIEALRRNLWTPLQQWFIELNIKVLKIPDTLNGYILKYSYYSDTEWFYDNIKCKKIPKLVEKENYYYLFGGKDEGSQAFLQGITLNGFLLDEVILMPESFVNQAVARCSEEDSKIWFFCNPGSPYHWFKVKWIDKIKQRNGLRLQFKMQDNPSLSERVLNKYRNTWDGVFKKRFVDGEWVVAEGAIYTKFINNISDYLITQKEIDELVENKRFNQILIGIDWGHNGSANGAVAVGVIGAYHKLIVLDEWYSQEKLDDDECHKKNIKFISDVISKYGFCTVYTDNAELMLHRGLKNRINRKKIKAVVRPCIKYKIIDRIVLENSLFAQCRILINKICTKLIEAFRDAIWDDKEKEKKGAKDVRLDDGGTNIDSLDMFEYAICGIMRQLENASGLIKLETNEE